RCHRQYAGRIRGRAGQGNHIPPAIRAWHDPPPAPAPCSGRLRRFRLAQKLKIGSWCRSFPSAGRFRHSMKPAHVQCRCLVKLFARNWRVASRYPLRPSVLNRLELKKQRVDMHRDFSQKRHRIMMMRLPEGLKLACTGRSGAWRALARRAALLVGGFGFGLAFASPALADFRVCNATQNLVGVGIGYRAKAGWITEGWWHIEASSCKTLIEGPLSSRFYYLYAEDAERGGRWDGPISM